MKVNFTLIGLFISTGLMLFAVPYSIVSFFDESPLPSESKEVLPHFVTVVLPAGMKGLVLGAGGGVVAPHFNVSLRALVRETRAKVKIVD